MVIKEKRPRIRNFGGKEFWLYGTAEEKKVARSVATTMRENNCYARVTRSRLYWGIWIRERSLR